MATAPNTFGKRLKEARELAGLSQRRLGIEAGLDEFVASTRVNRYERGVHEVDTVTAGQLAKALRVPRAYLYADEDAVARMILSVLPRQQGEAKAIAERTGASRWALIGAI